VRQTKHHVPLPTTINTRYREIDPLVADLPTDIKDRVCGYAGEYYRVSPTVASVDKSIMLMDETPCYKFEQDPDWKAVRKAVEDKLTIVFRHTNASTIDDFVATCNFDSASGLPFRLMGLSKKYEVFEHDDILDWIFSDEVTMSIPVWSVSGKIEWYHISKIDAGKVRTFIIPPLHLFIWQSLLYKEQHDALKEYWWSAYGFNPYNGGVDQLVAEMLANGTNRYGEWDVKKWDRILPLLRTVHKFRKKFTAVELKRFVEWVEANTVESFIMTPQGLILKKIIGNNSGSGSTTPDNIVSHMYIIYLLYYRIYGNHAQALAAFAKLFGDDCLSAVYSEKTPDQLAEITREVYALFGLELDPLVWQTTPEGLSFLGFKIVRWEGHWIPQYSLERIAASFSYIIEKPDTAASIAKAWTLMVMTAGHGQKIYEEFAEAVDFMLNKLSRNRDYDSDPVIASYCAMGVPSFAQVMCFYTGKEYAFATPTCFGSCLEEVGGINTSCFDE